MPYNPKADIHQYTWYLSQSTGKRYVCTSAGWAYDTEANEWRPSSIELLEFNTCTPRQLTFEEITELLQTGKLVVVKSPIGE